jgi:DNA polymerase-3 subunit alpha
LFWHAHAHSQFSSMDALSSVSDMVTRAVDLGQPALALTDHGTMGGVVDLYNQCSKADIAPFPGMEAYLAMDHNARTKRVHLTMLAYDETGYRNMVGLTRVMARDFYRKPLLTLPALAQLADDGLLQGIAVGTGCFFGLLPTMLRTNPAAVPNVIRALQKWFDGHVYAEIMHHGIYTLEHDDDDLSAAVLGVANELSMPAIFTVDSHYVYPEARGAHETMKRIGSWSSDPSDALFPGQAGYDLCDLSHVQVYAEPDVVAAGLAGLTELLNINKMSIPELDTFSLKVPHLPGVADADWTLRAKCLSSTQIVAAKDDSGTMQRLEDELAIIKATGFASYLLLTATITDWLRAQKFAFTARGSASGSLVCHALGITDIDPLEWGLRFDRFLSTDRTKPPDIDLDIQHDRREEVFEWLGRRYATLRIGSWMTMGLNEDADEQRGSLMVKWRSMLRKSGDDPNRAPTDTEYKDLQQLAAYAPTGGMGKHAGGVVIADSVHELSGVPVAWNVSSGHMQTAVDGDRVEKLGLPKIDLLGSKTMTMLNLVSTWTNTDWRVDPELAEPEIYRRMAEGDVVGVFQAEGHSTREGLKRLKPRHLADVVVSGALFRPALMDSGMTDEFLTRRRSRKKIPKIDPLIDAVLAETNGIFLYQEQVITVLRDIGMGAEELTRILKAVKASNENIGDAGRVMRSARDRVTTLCQEAGITEAGTTLLLDALEGYSKYGFNKAHAAAYGTISAVTAWYAVTYPVEFYAALLAVHDDKHKRLSYARAAREHGIRVAPAHVNASQVDYAPVGEHIVKGLVSIDNVGITAATELVAHAPYESLDDLVERCTPRVVTGLRDLAKGHPPSRCGPKTVIRALHEAGALADLGRREE